MLRSVTLVAVGLVLLMIASWAVTTVETGHVGVLTLSGRVAGEQLPEGIRRINPISPSCSSCWLLAGWPIGGSRCNR
jgi:hypothetical protein